MFVAHWNMSHYGLIGYLIDHNVMHTTEQSTHKNDVLDEIRYVNYEKSFVEDTIGKYVLPVILIPGCENEKENI
jgi:hypothetical protein